MAHTACAGGAVGARIAVLSVLVFAVGGGLAHADAPATDKDEKVNYNRQIRPIFADRCFACHGPDAAKRQADLRLDVVSEAAKEVLSPGDSAASKVVQRISSKDADERMPPPDSKKPPLTPEQIGLIRRWIAQGAKYEMHWAYVRPMRPSLPEAGDREWPINTVDCFIARGHARHGLKPAAEADRRTLLRRLSFDLIGIPPTPAEIAALVADTSPNAYEKQVDRLLASPHYGERMAVYWLDVVRYGDTGGYHSDNHRDVWLFRDWTIDAFNKNVPFDRFTIEQLAGDLLPNASRDQKIASGYNRLLMTTEEGGAQPKEYTAKFAADRVRNTASAWLGVTMGCAQCHDHKYDPFTTRDFYSFGAFFADVNELAVGRQIQTPMSTADQAARLKQLDQEIAKVQNALGAGLPTPPTERPKVSPNAKEPSGQSDRRGQETRAEREAQLKREREAFEKIIPTTLITEAVPPRVVRILPRGNWLDDSGEVVSPAIPASLGKLDTGDRRANRLDLARWFVSSDHPLVARVFVNRLWKQLFGQGIVKTLDDCGAQGAAPTHPELLDWLAVEFRESGWDVKRLVRLMVTSRTYRQLSEGNKESRQRDPTNLWLARQNRFRLDAEFVRDNALAVSGLLSRKIGGPSVKPYQPAGYWSFLNFPTRDYAADVDENQYRRGLYTYWQRTFLHPSLMAFDASTREECVAERARSNTPIQSLVLLNDPTYVEAARAFAQRMIHEGGATVPQRLNFAYEAALGRPPQPAEARLLADLYEKHRKHYASDEKAARALLEVGQSKPAAGIQPAELAACTSVARVILNLHETITRN